MVWFESQWNTIGRFLSWGTSSVWFTSKKEAIQKISVNSVAKRGPLGRTVLHN